VPSTQCLCGGPAWLSSHVLQLNEAVVVGKFLHGCVGKIVVAVTIVATYLTICLGLGGSDVGF
jgi:hypothetical protein